ncbi:hypothetical protein AcW2_005112 [Taiwanofungus camphoratus]|nr:hypothetical protein AcW2_005112 [Antrodia cinnamomea]
MFLAVFVSMGQLSQSAGSGTSKSSHYITLQYGCAAAGITQPSRPSQHRANHLHLQVLRFASQRLPDTTTLFERTSVQNVSRAQNSSLSVFDTDTVPALTPLSYN